MIRSAQHQYWGVNKCQWKHCGAALLENAKGPQAPPRPEPRRQEPAASPPDHFGELIEGDEVFVAGAQKTVRSVPSDGDCLFHALSLLLSEGGVPISAQGVREVCVKTAFKSRNDVVDPADPAATFSSEMMKMAQCTPGVYKKRMLEPGTWGGWLEIAAFSRALKVGVDVCCFDAEGSLGVWQSTTPTDSELGRAYVLFSKTTHYQALAQ